MYEKRRENAAKERGQSKFRDAIPFASDDLHSEPQPPRAAFLGPPLALCPSRLSPESNRCINQRAVLWTHLQDDPRNAGLAPVGGANHDQLRRPGTVASMARRGSGIARSVIENKITCRQITMLLSCSSAATRGFGRTHEQDDARPGATNQDRMCQGR